MDEGWKNRIRLMKVNGDNEGAIKELRRIKMTCYNKLKDDRDRFFIDYCLAYHAYTDENYDLSNFYLNEVKSIFKNRREVGLMELENSKFLWLNVNVNYKSMSQTQIVNDMIEVYRYYKKNDKKDIAISALSNIFKFQGEWDKVLEGFENLLQCEVITDSNFIDSFLKDCERESYQLYIKALDILNRYKVKININ